MTFRCSTTVLFVGMVLPAFMVSVGCQSTSQRLAGEILFDANGNERAMPGAFVFLRLVDAPHRERERIISDIAELIRTTKGYARIVAARELLVFLGEHPEYWTEDLATTIGKYVIAVNGFPAGTQSITPASLRVRSKRVREVEERIYPRCSLWFDAEKVLLKDGLPEGCQAADIGVIVDDTMVLARPGVYPGDPHLTIDLKKELERGGSVLGRHVIISWMVIIMPDGTRVEKKSTIEVLIGDMRDTVTDGR